MRQPRPTLFIIILAIVLSSCAASPEPEVIAPAAEEDEQEVQTVNSREALFVQDNSVGNNQPELELKLQAAPLLLASSYVRLAGVVSGRRPMALAEVGGRGQILELGDELLGYQVALIGPGSIKLIKQEDK